MRTFPTARYARGLPTVSSCLYGEQTGDAELATLVSAPCSPYRTQTTTATQTPPLATLAVCLRSPNNHNSNHNCNTNSSARYARSGHPAYGLHAQKEQIDLLATLGELFAPSSLSAVFGRLFYFRLLARTSLKRRKTKAAKIFCRLRSPHN